MKTGKEKKIAAGGPRPKAGFSETQALVRDCLKEMAAESLSFSRSGLRAVHRITGGESDKIRDLCRFAVFTLRIQNRQRAGRFFVLSCAKSLFPKEAGRLRAVRATLLLLLFAVSLLAGQAEQTEKILALLPLPGKQGATVQPPPSVSPAPAPVTTPEKEQETAGRQEADMPTAGRQEADMPTADRPPEYLGEIIVYDPEPLGDMIRNIYGPRTFNKQIVAAILALNPHVTDPDIIQPGVPILFPYMPVRLAPQAEQLWWVQLIRTRDIQNAFRFLEIFKYIAPPLLVIPSLNDKGDMLFNIILEESFVDRQAVDRAVASLSAATFPGITVLNGLARERYLYRSAEEVVAAPAPAAVEPAGSELEISTLEKPAPAPAVAAEPVVETGKEPDTPIIVPVSRLRIMELKTVPAPEQPAREASGPAAALPAEQKPRSESARVVEEDIPAGGEPIGAIAPLAAALPKEPEKPTPASDEPVETVIPAAIMPDEAKPVQTPPRPAGEAQSSRLPERMPGFLGEVVVYEQDTLGDMIRIIYGPQTFNKQNVATIMALNPQIFDSDIIQPGRSILFPVLPVKLDPQAEQRWWIRLLTTEDFRKAFSLLRRFKDVAPVMLLIPSLNVEGELLFNIILAESFRDRETAGGEAAKLPAESFPEMAILNGLHRGVYFYQ